MLGSFGEADDAVQDAWFRFAKADLADHRQRRRLVDHRHQPDLPRPVAAAPGSPRGVARRVRSRPGRHRRRWRRPGRHRGAGRQRRPGPADRARHAAAAGTTGVRAPRQLRPAVRRDRSDRRPKCRRDPPARQPRPPPRAATPRHSPPTPTTPFASASWSRRGPGPPRAATSMRCCNCSIPTSCCASTPATPPRRGGWSAPRASPGAPARSAGTRPRTPRVVLVNGAPGLVNERDGQPRVGGPLHGGRRKGDRRRHPRRPRTPRTPEPPGGRSESADSAECDPSRPMTQGPRHGGRPASAVASVSRYISSSARCQ